MKDILFARAGVRDDSDECGVTSIEYGLVAAAIALLVAAGLVSLGPKILQLFQVL